MESSGRPPKLLDRVRTAIRTRHYSRRTEEAYTHWIRGYIVFHGKRHPASLSAADISAFVSWLAEQRRVSASTQNQALSAVLFLYRDVLDIAVEGLPPIVRARTPERLPVVLGRDEVLRLLGRLSGTMHLIVTLLYGAGLRLEECLELRIKDIDHEREQIVVSPARIGGAEGGGARGARGGDCQACRAAHTAALLCDALESGYDIRTVQELLGHRDVRTTMTYLHVMQKRALGVKSPVDRL